MSGPTASRPEIEPFTATRESQWERRCVGGDWQYRRKWPSGWSAWHPRVAWPRESHLFPPEPEPRFLEEVAEGMHRCFGSDVQVGDWMRAGRELTDNGYWRPVTKVIRAAGYRTQITVAHRDTISVHNGSLIAIRIETPDRDTRP